MDNFFARLMPFLMMGVALVAFAFGLLLLTYLFVFGALIGLGLFLISWVKQRFFPSKQIMKPPVERRGETIDHRD